MKIALVQFNPTVGALAENARAIVSRSREAALEGADLVVFPELALCGYPPRDLLLQEGFLEDIREHAVSIAHELVGGPVIVLGAPWKPGGAEPDAFDRASGTTNSLLVLEGGRITHRYDKRLLPTYDVFDEHRYFTAGDSPCVIEVNGLRVGLSVCEDLWRGYDAGNEQRYMDRPDPVAQLVAAGAELIVNPSASPFVLGKDRAQRDILTEHVSRHGVALAAVNQSGANDDLIFDGHGCVYVPREGGAVRIAEGDEFGEGIVYAEIPSDVASWDSVIAIEPSPSTTDETRRLERALVVGVRDYVRKTGFSSVCLGISGGVDSALTAAIAARAVGPENVVGVMMPSRYSSEGSVADARVLADALGVRAVESPIREMHATAERTLDELFAALDAGATHGVTEENIQSRLRGLTMMAVSNQTGALLLSTGNKSELAVGYCTLYGDMNGGLAVLSDVTKARVYELSRWINENHEELGFGTPPIPVATIEKPPSAELRPDQTDQDTLPPYAVLDEIVERYVAEHQSVARIVEETGFESADVAQIVRLVDVNEYKRKQLSIGLKVTGVAFGRGRRRAIAQRYSPEISVPSV